MNPTLTLSDLPLFPLHTVLYPGGRLPLRLFEVRYLSLVQRCLNTASPFGVVTLRDDIEPSDSKFHATGTLAQIEGLSFEGAGLGLLQCSGHSRFQIRRARTLPHGLWVADVDILPADLPLPIPADLMHLSEALSKVLGQLPATPANIDADATRQEGQPILAENDSQPPALLADAHQLNDCGWVANRWCELLPCADQVRVQLLEQPSPLLRLELVSDMLQEVGILS